MFGTSESGAVVEHADNSSLVVNVHVRRGNMSLEQSVCDLKHARGVDLVRTCLLYTSDAADE